MELVVLVDMLRELNMYVNYNYNKTYTEKFLMIISDFL